ncbi:hypothetical protein C1645_744236 [Glomus cerebriforme]|uniref:Uncharacterized protein n=1 Tax=Glomus cerebriforme TaxID=658196 RepID=A0A397S607_9GLOM|nr:hypothetical protein C1645_744236 [Glomus cerebriforme]
MYIFFRFNILIVFKMSEFTELECYLAKEYEDLKSLWLEFNDQYEKAKSEEEVLIQMLREIKKTTEEETQNSCLDDHTDSLMRYMYEIENKASSPSESSISEYNESIKRKPLEKAGNDITDSFDLLTLSSPSISEIGESDYTALESQKKISVLTEKSSGFNIKDNLNNALRKLQKLDEEDYDISQDEEMTDILLVEKESRTLLTHESDDDHEINDDIDDDGWNEDKTRLALKDMLDMMREQNN